MAPKSFLTDSETKNVSSQTGLGALKGKVFERFLALEMPEGLVEKDVEVSN